MTPLQYHFPFFLDLKALNAELFPMQWMAGVSDSEDSERPAYLTIERIGNSNHASKMQSSIKVGFHETLMIQDNRLFCWKKYDDGLFVRQFDLTGEDPNSAMLSEFIEILSLEPGKHAHTTTLSYSHFVTFIRKGNLVRKEDYFEQYVILLMHRMELSIIPFYSFNETGGDQMYMWPALASLDIASGKLHGHGMRMGSFTIELGAGLIDL